MADSTALGHATAPDSHAVLLSGKGVKRGRRRAASATTRVFGHFMAEKTPRATWCVGVLKLSKDPGGDIMRDTIFSRITKMSRFRSKLVVNRFGGYFEEFNDAQMERLRDEYLWVEELTSGTATDDDIKSLVGNLESWDYNKDYPLWRIQYIRTMADGSATVVVCINHAIGDGVSLIATLMTITDEHQALGGGVSASTSAQAKIPGKKAGKGPKLHPIKKISVGAYGVMHGATSSFWRPDRNNALSMPDVHKPSKQKKLASCEPISLDAMKAVKNKFPGATLNDIMMTVMTATLRAYYLEVGDPAGQGKGRVRGAFPINLRAPGSDVFKNDNPANIWAYGTFNFNFKYKTLTELVWKVKRQVDKIKVSPSPKIMSGMATVLTKTMPRPMLLNQLISMANLCTAQLSNVPGPSEKVSIAGVQLEDMFFYLLTPVGLYFGIMTYAGKVTAGVNVDGSSKCDPQQLAKHWKEQFDLLEAEVKDVETVPLPKIGIFD